MRLIRVSPLFLSLRCIKEVKIYHQTYLQTWCWWWFWCKSSSYYTRRIFTGIVCKLAFNVLKREITIKDVNKENFQKAADAIIDEDFNKMVNDLPDDWINSSISGANALYQLYGSKGKFTFHRGSQQVNIIER